MADEDIVSQLYAASGKLKESGVKEEESYTFLLGSVTSADAKARQLVADLLPEYFKLFPSLAEKALNAQLDLCEDPELQIRCHAVRGLFHIGQANATYIPRIADVLAQLLLAEEVPEIKAVRDTLTQTFTLSPRSCFTVIMQHANDSEEALRMRAFEFFQLQFKQHLAQINKDPEFQAEVVAAIKKVLLNARGASDAEFKAYESNLKQISSFAKGSSFAAQMRELIEAQITLPETFDPSDENAIVSMINVLKRQGPYLKPLEGSKFLDYFLLTVLPSLQEIPESQRLILLRAVVEHRRGISPVTARLAFPTVYQAFIDQIPTDGAASDGVASEATSSSVEVKAAATDAAAPVAGDKAVAPADPKAATTLNKIKINFSFVECLLLLLHTLGKLAPEALRLHCGIFIPTGQPGEAALKQKREALLERLKALEQGCGDKGFDVPIKKFTELSKTIATRLKGATGDSKKGLEGKLAFVHESKSSVVNLKALCEGLKQKDFELKDLVPSWKQGHPQRGQGGGGRMQPQNNRQKGVQGGGQGGQGKVKQQQQQQQQQQQNQQQQQQQQLQQQLQQQQPEQQLQLQQR
eukprot:gb/GEZN01001099.1/.p1 GENE.gb/GEZN01001099.1/~~gb/GEZN01001099.1/.p1  ORF type:complete len:581 (-),score=153.32 gb/GEZN01001099.1/:1516-3258(-)